MADQIGTLYAEVIADQAGFRSDMAAMARTVTSTTSQMNARLAQIGKASDALAGSFRLITRAAGAFGVAISVRALTQFTTQSLNAAAELHNLSTRLNVTTESMSELQHVARVNDIEFASFTKSLQIMAKNFGEATSGSKSMQDTFRQLGLDFKLLSTLSLDVQLESVAEALSRVENESQRAALAQEVLGRGGIEMLQAFENGAEGVRILRQQLRDLGGVTTTEMGKASDDAKDAMDRLRASAKGLGDELTLALAPALTTATQKLREMFFPTEKEALISGTSAAIERIKEQIAELEAHPVANAKGGVATWLRGLFGDEQENASVFAAAQQQLASLKTSLEQMTAGLESAKSAGGAAGGGASIPGLTGTGGGAALEEISVVAQRIEAMRSMEFMFQTEVAAARDEAMARNVERMQQEVAAWDEFVQERKRQEDEVAEYKRSVMESTVAGMGSFFEQMMSMQQGHSKSSFALAKKAAIANAILSTYLGVAKVLEQNPGPPGWAMAATQAAMGLLQVQRLRSTSFDSADPAAAVSSTLGTTANPINARSTSATSTSSVAAAPHQQKVIEINIRGGVVGSAAVRELVAEIKREIDDSDVILIGPSSVQGRLLGAGA